MKATRRVATIALLLPLAACGTSGNDNKPDTKTPTPTPASSSPTITDLALGTPARTVGAASSGTSSILEITPSSVVYVPAASGDKPAKDLFVVVAYKARAMTAAATETAPMGGGGWQWIAPDRQAVSPLDGNAVNVVPHGYNGGTVQPGTFQWHSIAIDISTAQRGGTLLYTDGDSASFRWKMPATDSGPDAAKLKAELAR